MDKRVLLIGENEKMVSMMGRMISRSGFQIEEAVGAVEALTAIRKEMPQLIVMECDLPDGNGIELCRFLRRHRQLVKIMLISSDSVDEVTAFEAGADDFIKKPYHMDVLIARMKRLCSLC